jgi:acetylornithine/N-succinyldiaminopimelate aminotransferase
VGAMWACDEVAAAFRPGDHGSTYAGQALALAAAQATLAELERIDAPAVAREKEAKLRSLLGEIDGVSHVRGRGLLLGIELGEDVLGGRTGPEIARACLDRGLILNGITPTALRIAPPFIISDDQLSEGMAVMASVLHDQPKEH